MFVSTDLGKCPQDLTVPSVPREATLRWGTLQDGVVSTKTTACSNNAWASILRNECCPQPIRPQYDFQWEVVVSSVPFSACTLRCETVLLLEQGLDVEIGKRSPREAEKYRTSAEQAAGRQLIWEALQIPW